MGNLAFIPARSGSKQLKNKNIKLLNGKPLLAYSIECAKTSNCFEEILVSTDSQEYADIANQYGANTPFLRSKELSSDKASTWDAVKDALKRYRDIDRDFDTVTILQPTSPLRKPEDIQGCFNLMEEKSAQSVVSVCEPDHSPLWCNTLPEDLSFVGFINEKLKSTPRQDLPVYYMLNGSVYIVKTEVLWNNEEPYIKNSYAYIMPKERSVDIDTIIDFKLAEFLINENR